MKRAVFILGVLVIFLLVLGVQSGNIFDGIAAILWLPVTLLWDIPMLILPVTFVAMFALSIYGVATKNYQKLYSWYRNLFILGLFWLSAYDVESLFRTTSFFKLPEYIAFFVYFFSMLSLVGFCAYVETKKDARYYIVVSGFVLIYLIWKFICFVH